MPKELKTFRVVKAELICLHIHAFAHYSTRSIGRISSLSDKCNTENYSIVSHFHCPVKSHTAVRMHGIKDYTIQKQLH